MIMEDQAPTRDALTGILRGEGYHVVAPVTSEEALDHLLTAPHPRVILLDERMPASHGLRFARWRKQNPDLASVPLVLMRERDSSPDWVAELESSTEVPKPVGIDFVLETIQRFR
jgi:CheY-like chemotaxis protein